LQELREGRRGRQRTSGTQGMGSVGIGQCLPGLGHEELARHFTQGGEDPAIGNIAGAQLIVDHAAASGFEIGHRSSPGLGMRTP